MTTLMQAFNQWASRPADERFSSLESLITAVRSVRERARTSKHVNLAQCEVTTLDETPMLRSPSGVIADMTHHAFGQLCRLVEAPAHYLRTLPAALAADNLNLGLCRLPESADADTMAFDATLLVDMQDAGAATPARRIRQFCSEKYGRIWNLDVALRLQRLTHERPEWQPAPAAFDGSRGLYASDEDMFCFMVDNDRRIFESLPGGGLGRGFFVSNSEVGAGSFTVTTFLYEYVCGNHRVWGAKGVKELRIPHLGNADEKAFRSLTIELTKYADSSASYDEELIRRARAKIFGATKDEVLDAVFGLRIDGMSRKMIAAGFDRAVEREDRYGDPTSAWALAGGITELSQEKPNAKDRTTLDRAAGKLMEVAF